MNSSLWKNIGFSVGVAVAALSGSLGCTTDSFCFADCTPGAGISSGGSTGAVGTDGGLLGSSTGGGGATGTGTGGTAGGTGCGVAELCNGQDDNCNGKVDEGIDFTKPEQCGTCENNCRTKLTYYEQASITCTPPPVDQLGKVAGTCGGTRCAPGHWDIDGDPANGCEYLCQNNPDGTVTVDKDNPDSHGNAVCGVDDDCDGKIDEDLDLCHDVQHCGACNISCHIANGVPKCVSTATGDACNTTNTDCEVDHCNPGWYAIPTGGTGCWYQCTPTNNGVEICDGLDNDCDNLIDNADPDLTPANDARLGASCAGNAAGECAAPEHAGIAKCIAGAVACCDVDSKKTQATNPNLPQKTGLNNGECKGTVGPFVLHPGDLPEICNGKDDDCDGTKDDAVTDSGQACGSSAGVCSKGVNSCINGVNVCSGQVAGSADDPCNGADDNCDSVIDGIALSPVVPCTADAQCAAPAVCMVRASVTDKVCATPDARAGTPCNPPPPPPCVDATGKSVTCGSAGAVPAYQPCTAGVYVCAGQLVCQPGKPKTSDSDRCGQDLNCDGRLDNQPNLLTDVANCGSCGNDCNAKGAHVAWSCNNGVCAAAAPNKCRPGYIDCDGNANDCERACTPSGSELCNGVDDDCNCKIDDAIVTPPPSQVCGVKAASSDPNCGPGNGQTSGVGVSCSGGKWVCKFIPGYCDQGASQNCATTPDVCDGKDNNCNGNTDENQKLPVLKSGYLGQDCFSDDGKPPPGDGVCQAKGQYICNGPNATKCNATKDLSKAGAETCNGLDDDCDGLVDETSSNKGTSASFVAPAVVKFPAANTWIYQYEASRPSATTQDPGSGNGYVTSAPAGVTLDKTPACSVPGRIPWYNVTPAEVEQTCAAQGGTICGSQTWTTACQGSAGGCTWGYGATCTAAANYTSGPFCNLSARVAPPALDALLVTKSSALDKCYATYGGNPPSTGLFDITGNLREITKRGTEDYPLMGGAYDTEAESGATCSFDFYSVPSTFKLYDTGFRCCFGTDPGK